MSGFTPRLQRPAPKPDWIRVRIRTGEHFNEVREMVDGLDLHTVCQEARCPNIFECFSNRTATFMILGDNCTRRCAFCAVGKLAPLAPDPGEPLHVAEAVASMRLRHAVVTSVNRDDLPDQGAGQFVATIREIRRLNPATRIEVLIPDFQGDEACLGMVLDAAPDILNHNMESVPRLYRRVRAGADYRQSLDLLARAAAWREGGHDAGRGGARMMTKSGLMVGLGETIDELLAVMDDLRACGVDILTIGQYLRPSMSHLPVERFYTPDEFGLLKREGLARGFGHVESGPLVRSSYHAHEQAATVAP